MSPHKTVIICINEKLALLDTLVVEVIQALGDSYLVATADTWAKAVDLVKKFKTNNYDIAVMIANYEDNELLKHLNNISPESIHIVLTESEKIQLLNQDKNVDNPLFHYIKKDWQLGELRFAIKESIHEYVYNKIMAEQNEKLNQLTQLKEKLLADSSHKLRTPLHGIIGFAECLYHELGQFLLEEHKEMLSMIIQNGYHLSSLIDELFDFSALKTLPANVELQPINLYKLVDDMLSIHRTTVRKKSLRLINEISQNLPTPLGDEEKIQQILNHLITNAIEFSNSGYVQASAEIVKKNVHSKQQSYDPTVLETVPPNKLATLPAWTGCYLAVMITDTGAGISSTQLDNIFHHFEQINDSIDQENKGLLLIKQLIEAQQGELFIQSTQGKGTQFTFTLPLAQKTEENITVLQLIDQTAAEPSQKKLSSQVKVNISESQSNIIIVDDDFFNLQVLAAYLSHKDYQLTEATSGQEVFAMLAQGTLPDLIIVDNNMPGMTGQQVVERIRKTWSMIDLPVILLTAKGQTSDLVRGLEAGANDYLVKPITREELLVRVQVQLRIKATCQQKIEASRSTFN